MLSVTRFYFCT